MPIRREEEKKRKGIKHLNTHYTQVAPSCYKLISYLSDHLKFHIKQSMVCPKPAAGEEKPQLGPGAGHRSDLSTQRWFPSLGTAALTNAAFVSGGACASASLFPSFCKPEEPATPGPVQLTGER